MNMVVKKKFNCNIWLLNVHSITKLPRTHLSKLISKDIDANCYGECNLDILKEKSINSTGMKPQL
jgi:hypothetical protein